MVQPGARLQIHHPFFAGPQSPPRRPLRPAAGARGTRIESSAIRPVQPRSTVNPVAMQPHKRRLQPAGAGSAYDGAQFTGNPHGNVTCHVSGQISRVTLLGKMYDRRDASRQKRAPIDKAVFMAWCNPIHLGIQIVVLCAEFFLGDAHDQPARSVGCADISCSVAGARASARPASPVATRTPLTRPYRGSRHSCWERSRVYDSDHSATTPDSEAPAARPE